MIAAAGFPWLHFISTSFFVLAAGQHSQLLTFYKNEAIAYRYRLKQLQQPNLCLQSQLLDTDFFHIIIFPRWPMIHYGKIIREKNRLAGKKETEKMNEENWERILPKEQKVQNHERTKQATQNFKAHWRCTPPEGKETREARETEKAISIKTGTKFLKNA